MAQLQDDGFHEIQLNGKQLVFLFMAATVVSVVIFLCGVLVGRGVRAERAGSGDSASNALTEAVPQQPATPPPPPAGSDPTAAPAPAPAADDLSYFKRLEKPNAPAEQIRPTADKAPAEKDKEKLAAKTTPAPPAREKAPAEKPAATPAEKAATPPAPAPALPLPAVAPPAAAPPPVAERTSEEPPGQGYVVQIAALNVRSDADAMVKRLASKGYAAYVLAPVSGMPSVFRVRVGKFSTRREAESVAARLQKEEQFKPWITR